MGDIPVTDKKFSQSESEGNPEAVESGIKLMGLVPIVDKKFSGPEPDESVPETIESWIKFMGLFAGRFLYGVDAGTANTRTVLFDYPGITNWENLEGVLLLIKSGNVNTDTTTLSVNSLAPAMVKKYNQGVLEDLSPSDLIVGMIGEYILDENGILLLQNPASAGGVPAIALHAVTLDANGHATIADTTLTNSDKIFISPSSGNSNMAIQIINRVFGIGFELQSTGLDSDSGLVVNWFKG